MLIVDRGRPVARLEPAIQRLQGGQNGRLSRLLRDGLIRPRRVAPPRALFIDEPPRTNTGVSAVDGLIEERRQGR